jgi:hypothetical protein
MSVTQPRRESMKRPMGALFNCSLQPLVQRKVQDLGVVSKGPKMVHMPGKTVAHSMHTLGCAQAAVLELQVRHAFVCCRPAGAASGLTCAT